jgi:hypothetical protein
LLNQVSTTEPHDADPPIDIDGRLQTGTSAVTYNVRGLTITIDFEILCRDALLIADSVFQECFEGLVTNLQSATDEYVAATLQHVDRMAAATLSDYYIELVMHGVAFAAESFAEEMARQLGRHLTTSERKGYRAFARESTAFLAANRIPSVGRGGKTRLAEKPLPATLINFHKTIERAYPFWRDVRQRAGQNGKRWQSDIKKLPEYGRFTFNERKHADAVLVLLQKGRKVNGAVAEPRVLAREHARLVLGLPQTSDSVLRKYAAQGKQLSLTTKVRPERRR